MRKKEIILTSIFILLLVSFSTYFSFIKNKNKQEDLSVMKNEEMETVLSYIKNTKDFKAEYEKFYSQINYHPEHNFFKEINIFLNLQYTPQEINTIYDFLNSKNKEKLLSHEKIEIQNYYNIKNFDVDKIKRYEDYKSIHNCSLEEAILKVNIGLNHDFYTQIEQIEIQEDYTVLVNKYRSLGNYEPSDLKSLSYDEKYKLREKAADAFEELISFAKTENVYIRPYSAYRSFEYQTALYNKYVEKDGKELADTYSARPGHSEHQTGLAVDVWSEGHTEITVNDAKWLSENAHKYGFIVRYTKENEKITGYIEEPWHLRYLGMDVAKDVVNKRLTYDEYYDLYIK